MNYDKHKKHAAYSQDAFNSMVAQLNITADSSRSYVGLGWLPVVRKCFEAMIAAGWNRELEQIKQKFCQLRIYISQPTEIVQDGKFVLDENGKITLTELGKLIYLAVNECDKLCEVCGCEREKKGVRSGWALCNECEGQVEA